MTFSVHFKDLKLNQIQVDEKQLHDDIKMEKKEHSSPVWFDESENEQVDDVDALVWIENFTLPEDEDAKSQPEGDRPEVVTVPAFVLSQLDGEMPARLGNWSDVFNNDIGFT